MEISKSKLSLYSSLKSKKMRVRHGMFTVEGEKCVSDMLGSFEIISVIADREWSRQNMEKISSFPCEVLTVTPQEMKKISNLVSLPKVIAVFRLPGNSGNVLLNPETLHLMLDGIQDPGNLGTIIRTADWFGFHTIYASHETADVFNPKTIQSAMGSLSHVKVVYADLKKLILESGIKEVCGLMLEGEDMFGSKVPKRGAVIMGNEGNGLSEGIRDIVTTPLLIPPYDTLLHGESLNVGIATGITLAWLRNS